MPRPSPAVAQAFAPAHLSAFFAMELHPLDLLRSGSRGAGLCLTEGAWAQVHASPDHLPPGEEGEVHITLDGEPALAPTTQAALQEMLGGQRLATAGMPAHFQVHLRPQLPLHQGFGMSGAGTLAACLALGKLLGVPPLVAQQCAHVAEVSQRTGLGDVAGMCVGGMAIRTSAGAPGCNSVLHIPLRPPPQLVMAQLQEGIKTMEVLNDPQRMAAINAAATRALERTLAARSLEELLRAAAQFDVEAGLLPPAFTHALEAIEGIGVGARVLLGGTLMALGDVAPLQRRLAPFGATRVVTVGNVPARTEERWPYPPADTSPHRPA